MVHFMVNLPSIQNIFAKKLDGYTPDALLYQDILRYSINNLETKSKYSFKLWELTDWLISNNREIVDDYKKTSSAHMTRSNKIQARIARVKRHIDVLVYLGLIGELGQEKEAKGQGTVVVYSYTEFGLIISFLIMTMSPSKRLKAVDYLYRTFRKNFKTNPSSLDVFCLSFMTKLYMNKLFDKYADAMLYTAEKGSSIGDANDFFASSLILDLNENDSKLFLKIKEQAFDVLPLDMKKNFMHLRKLEIEALMFRISKNLKNFEKTRFEYRNYFEKLVTEGFCENCKLYFVMVLPLVQYLKNIPHTNYVTAKCPSCCEDNSIKIPSFRV